MPLAVIHPSGYDVVRCSVCKANIIFMNKNGHVWESLGQTIFEDATVVDPKQID